MFHNSFNGQLTSLFVELSELARQITVNKNMHAVVSRLRETMVQAGVSEARRGFHLYKQCEYI